MTAPKPDRSNSPPNLVKTDENQVLDIGWNEGFLTDGRPYRGEYWAQEQVSSVTFFLSTKGMERFTNQQFIELLEREKLLAWRPGGFKSAYAMPFTDPSGDDMWTVNVVVGDDEQTFADVLIPMRAYERETAAGSVSEMPG